MRAIKKFIKDESGVTAMEYALIAAAIALVVGAAFTSLGDSISSIVQKVSDKLA